MRMPAAAAAAMRCASADGIARGRASWLRRPGVGCRVRGQCQRGAPCAQPRAEAVGRLGKFREVEVVADVERLDVESQLVHQRPGQRAEVGEVAAHEHAADIHLLVLAQIDQGAAELGGDARGERRAAGDVLRLGRAVGLGAPGQLAREQHHAAVDDGDGCRLRVHGEHGDHGIGKQGPALPDERGVGEGRRRDGLDADAGIDKRLESGAQFVGGDRDVARLSAPVAQRPRDDRISQRRRRKTAGRGAGFAAGHGLQVSRGRRRQQEGLMAASQAPDGHRGAARQVPSGPAATRR